jgi:hypothetical protein
VTGTGEALAGTSAAHMMMRMLHDRYDVHVNAWRVVQEQSAPCTAGGAALPRRSA